MRFVGAVRLTNPVPKMLLRGLSEMTFPFTTESIDNVNSEKLSTFD